MDLTIANRGGSTNMLRDYRKGNWTLQETMVLIEAKKMDDQRRMKRLGDAGERGKPAELRWKWVEDCCWKHGCLRSQNQCNDKWDNLMRDFKKVREYERRVAERGGGEDKSYWRIDKNERKDNNLPSNMLLRIYEALVEVVDRKGPGAAAGGSGGAGSSNANVPTAVEKSTPVHALDQHSLSPPELQQQQYSIVQTPTMLLPPPLPSQPPPEPPAFPPSQPLPTVDSDTSGHTDSPAKRRKRRGSGGDREGTSGRGGGEVGSAISRSAAILAEAIQSSEERQERRHRELLSLHQRRLQIEESKAETNSQGIDRLVDAIDKLANSILAFASHREQSPSK